jgi:hypothetical protein
MRQPPYLLERANDVSRRFAPAGFWTSSRERETQGIRMTSTDPAPAPLPPTPRVRGDCENGPRPCPFTTCRHHLGEGLAESCALDVADRGGLEQADLARLLRVSRNRVYQVESAALEKLRAAGPVLGIEPEPRAIPRARVGRAAAKAGARATAAGVVARARRVGARQP